MGTRTFVLTDKFYDLFSSVRLSFRFRSSRLSIFQRGMSNWVLNFAIVFETLVALVLIYIPGLNSGLQVGIVVYIVNLPQSGNSCVMSFFQQIAYI
jgi:sodium/potassium-transporting ATPase subunit alpha